MNGAAFISRERLLSWRIFLSVSIIFGPLVNATYAAPQAQGWADYLRDRYSFLS